MKLAIGRSGFERPGPHPFRHQHDVRDCNLEQHCAPKEKVNHLLWTAGSLPRWLGRPAAARPPCTTTMRARDQA
eukprot:945692-Rhodomonas_salina.1